jgi:single-strand DNA-binding protein
MNKAIIIGNVGTISTGNGHIKFSIATTDKWKDKSSGEQKEKTEWHNIFVPGKYSETLTKILKVGQRVAVEGAIQYSSYEKDGQKMYSTSIVSQNVEIVNWGKEVAGEDVPF